jgi:hypothetical protein
LIAESNLLNAIDRGDQALQNANVMKALRG